MLVRKKGGGLRVCTLNKDTVQDRFPIPRIDELVDIYGGKIQGYNIRSHERVSPDTGRQGEDCLHLSKWVILIQKDAVQLDKCPGDVSETYD